MRFLWRLAVVALSIGANNGLGFWGFHGLGSRVFGGCVVQDQDLGFRGFGC